MSVFNSDEVRAVVVRSQRAPMNYALVTAKDGREPGISLWASSLDSAISEADSLIEDAEHHFHISKGEEKVPRIGVVDCRNGVEVDIEAARGSLATRTEQDGMGVSLGLLKLLHGAGVRLQVPTSVEIDRPEDEFGDHDFRPYLFEGDTESKAARMDIVRPLEGSGGFIAIPGKYGAPSPDGLACVISEDKGKCVKLWTESSSYILGEPGNDSDCTVSMLQAGVLDARWNFNNKQDDYKYPQVSWKSDDMSWNEESDNPSRDGSDLSVLVATVASQMLFHSDKVRYQLGVGEIGRKMSLAVTARPDESMADIKLEYDAISRERILDERFEQADMPLELDDASTNHPDLWFHVSIEDGDQTPAFRACRYTDPRGKVKWERFDNAPAVVEEMGLTEQSIADIDAGARKVAEKIRDSQSEPGRVSVLFGMKYGTPAAQGIIEAARPTKKVIEFEFNEIHERLNLVGHRVEDERRQGIGR